MGGPAAGENLWLAPAIDGMTGFDMAPPSAPGGATAEAESWAVLEEIDRQIEAVVLARQNPITGL
uniref:hypothetical protein n=1 Tax=Cyanobium sp. TaxID=2164130 RepID=UPI00404AB020